MNYDELTHAYDFAFKLRDIASTSCLDLSEGNQVGALIRALLLAVLECTMLQEGDQAIYITWYGASNSN